MFFQLRNRVGCHFLYLSVGLGDPHELDASSQVEIDHPKRMERSDPTIHFQVRTVSFREGKSSIDSFSFVIRCVFGDHIIPYPLALLSP